MKKFLTILLVFVMSGLSTNAAVMNLSDAMAQNSTKPMAVFLYADWADGYQSALAEFRKVEKAMANTYNFVELNIASKDAKIYNSNNVIYTNLPYIMAYRSNGKFALQVTKDCAMSSSCIISKFKTFVY